jgi:hypothetical protein
MTIACGVDDFKREPGGFAAIIIPIFLDNVASSRGFRAMWLATVDHFALT